MRQALQDLLNARAVRERCTVIGELAMDNKTRWFRIRQSRLASCAEFVADTCRRNYPQLDIPYHSRWRHFNVNGVDLWGHYDSSRLRGMDNAMKTRTAIDLVFVSVLLDAGAGTNWRFDDPVTGARLERSEGLAAASVDLFFNRLAKYNDKKGCYVDAQALQSLTADEFISSFQHTAENPLLGVEGRIQLLWSLGAVLSAADKYSRPGNIYDVLRSRCASIAADEILSEVLAQFGSIWPNGLIHDGFNLGDCGYHGLLESRDCTTNIVPFHKLSQWLSYSLVEPLQCGGLKVTDMDSLTGLPEYRNGGLLIDTGVIEPVDPGLLHQRLSVASEAVVEWRALTVFLLDRMAEMVRLRLGRNKDQLPLSGVLEGGTWAAGRRIAAQLRCDGSPPVDLAIDGTVF